MSWVLIQPGEECFGKCFAMRTWMSVPFCYRQLYGKGVIRPACSTSNSTQELQHIIFCWSIAFPDWLSLLTLNQLGHIFLQEATTGIQLFATFDTDGINDSQQCKKHHRIDANLAQTTMINHTHNLSSRVLPLLALIFYISLNKLT